MSATDTLCGRYALIYQAPGLGPRLVGDATGMRAIFFIPARGIAGSHAKLVNDAVFREKTRRTPFKGGHPGHGTPYRNVMLLVPNCLLDLESGKLARFWPRAPREQKTLDEVLQPNLVRAARALSGMAQRSGLLLSLTAGQDSRTTLAAALLAEVDLEAFTLVNRRDSPHGARTRILGVDAAVAKEITAAYGISHQVLEEQPMDDRLKTYLKANAYKSSYSNRIMPLLAQYGQQRLLHVRSNALEIARAYWAKHPEVDDANGAADLFMLKHRKLADQVERVRTAFQDMFHATDFTAGRQMGYDSRDMLYWEHRMGAWHSQQLLCSDLVFDTFNPWNCRAILTDLLSLPMQDRANSSFSRAVVDACEGLSKWPINPAKWPE
ncbi:hypothetical protein VCB98_10790 [Gammaproteobacteria bacterium AB-CW1]|uniref:Asparagine synthetase domain-containing protein n=1 Tax=Natronospira elongata TaxID=3110268 RepID=A0AAP6MN95_9GAMM|nr:hypothetical protein [Gammaproteobacteria bacterium AB-CW1]